MFRIWFFETWLCWCFRIMVMNGLMVDYRAVWFYLGIQAWFVCCGPSGPFCGWLWAWAYVIWFLLVKPSIQFCFVLFLLLLLLLSFFEVGDFMGCLIFFYEIVTLCVFLGLILMTLSAGCLASKKFTFMYCLLCSRVDWCCAFAHVLWGQWMWLWLLECLRIFLEIFWHVSAFQKLPGLDVLQRKMQSPLKIACASEC